jgi:fermentation-respiration switch protein FrsA (DUF1100 family)
MRWWQAAAVAAPAVGAGGFLTALFWFSRRWIAPPREQFDPPHATRADEVSFSAIDGTPIAAWLLHGQPNAPALILCHGYQRCMEETFSLGVDLRTRGFTVLLFDFRGCGRSGGRYTTIGDLEVADLLGAVAWLRARLGPATPIGVHGISMGGSVTIRAAAACPDIDAVVADSAFAHLAGAVEHRFRTLRFPSLQLHRLTMRTAERLCGGRVARVRPVDVVGAIAPRPILFIHGTADDIVPFSHFEELYAAAGTPKDAWTLPGRPHAMARFDEAEEYLDRVAGFFWRALAPTRTLAAAH